MSIFRDERTASDQETIPQEQAQTMLQTMHSEVLISNTEETGRRAKTVMERHYR